LSKASLNLKSALWGDKPEGLLPENCPNFWPDKPSKRVSDKKISLAVVILIMISPKGPEKLKFFQPTLGRCPLWEKIIVTALCAKGRGKQ
jgi:hypothetical protein